MTTHYWAFIPSQCKCGHIYQETYTFDKPNADGAIGFCWCGWCRTREDFKPTRQEEREA